MLNKLAYLCFILLFLVSCGPGQVFGPTITPQPTFTLVPTNTSIPTRTPLPTPTKKVAYYLEVGICFDFTEIEGDPKDFGCVVISREKLSQDNIAEIELDADEIVPFTMLYCAIYDSKNLLIDKKYDEEGIGKVSCSIY